MRKEQLFKLILLEAKLNKVGLIITNKEWSFTDKGFEYKAEVKCINNELVLREGAMHSNLSVSSIKSPEDVILELFKKMINPESIIFLGIPFIYSEKITWNQEEEKFERVRLSESESIEVNCFV